jgi:hypothetical protein
LPPPLRDHRCSVVTSALARLAQLFCHGLSWGSGASGGGGNTVFSASMATPSRITW